MPASRLARESLSSLLAVRVRAATECTTLQSSPMNTTDYCVIDDDTYEAVSQTQGAFFEKICLIGREKITRDLLDPAKALNQATLLERYCVLQNRKVLEIGSGLGVNHIVWSKKHGIDGYGVEPSEAGFDSSHAISKRLIARNGLDASRIIDARGEALPFPDNSFDVVYSTNVLEHTRDPEGVMREALRVLRPDGVMQFVYPNFRSYFDGHYAVFHPPIFWAWFFPWYVNAFFGRDPGFARTLRTELNVGWTQGVLARLRAMHDFSILGLGTDTFLERMSSAPFDAWAGLTKVGVVLNAVRRLRLDKIVARSIVRLSGHSPIILTIRKHTPGHSTLNAAHSPL